MFQYIGELCRYLLAVPPGEAELHHRLRLCVGNGLSAHVWERFAARFAIERIIEFYASTEGSFSLFNLEGRPGAIGRIPRFIAHRAPVAIVAFDADAAMPLRGSDGFCRRCMTGEVGEAIGRVANASSFAERFEGYTDAAETARKVLRDVFERGDAWFRTGDLMRQDRDGFFYFVDRIGDTFRWKGENVAAASVADALSTCSGVVEVAVYGVPVPYAEGRAGMAALVVSPDFSLKRLTTHISTTLPPFARPLFLRLVERLDTTGTFRTKKQDLSREGYDPTLVADSLYVFDPGSREFVTLDAERLAQLEAGTTRL
jgi:fatty-acyl-CoA synthase